MPDFSSLNLNAFDSIPWESKGSPGKQRLDRDIRRLVKGKPVTVRFITNPTKYHQQDDLSAFSTSDGSWVRYHEVNTSSGFKGDIQSTNWYIPTNNVLFLNGTKTDQRDPLYEQVRLSKFDIQEGKTSPAVKEMLLVNVIYEDGSFAKKPGSEQYDPVPGQQILLSLNPAQVKSMKQFMEHGIQFDPSFSWTRGSFTLTYHQDPSRGGSDAWYLSIKMNDAPPLDTLPNPIDGMALLRDIRAQAEEEAFGADTEAVSLDDVEAAFTEEDQAVGDEPAEEAQAPASTQRKSPAYVKGALRKEGIQVPTRISNEDLYALAEQHGIAS